jgi:hypothetical protein
MANDQALTPRVQYFPDLTIDAGGFTRGGINHLRPFLVPVVEFGHLQEIGGLQDRLQRIAEIVGQGTKVGHVIDRLGGIFHGSVEFEQSAFPL